MDGRSWWTWRSECQPISAPCGLTRLSPELYADVLPPERLLKASLLIALYSVRSERAFCEELDYMLFRWFLGMQLMERTSIPRCTKNRLNTK